MNLALNASFRFRRFHNGSLHILPFAGDGFSTPGGRKGEHAVRCRASNAYGRVVSRLVTIKPGELVPQSNLSLLFEGLCNFFSTFPRR